MRRGERGYVLLSVLMLVSLIVTTAVGYAHHTTAGYRSSSASLSIQESRESAHAAFALADRMLAAGSEDYQGTLESGGQTVELELAALGSDQAQLRVEALHGGLGATVEARLTLRGALDGALPQLAATAAAAVAGDPAQLRLSGTQSLQDAVVDGTLVLARGSRCTLRDVVVRGSIVSEPALAGPPYLPVQAVTLTIEGSLRVDGDTLLPGCAIVMPDGELVVTAAAAVELHGVVLARACDWEGGGAADHHILAAEGVELPAWLDRPGYGRTPPEWPSSLVPAGLAVSRLAFPVHRPTLGELAAIKGFFQGKR